MINCNVQMTIDGLFYTPPPLRHSTLLAAWSSWYSNLCFLCSAKSGSLFLKQRNKNFLGIKESSSFLSRRQNIWSPLSPFEFPCVITVSVCRRKDSLWFALHYLLETYLQSRAAHVALISGRELPVLWELGERRAASFPESQSRFPESQPRISCVGLGPGEVEPACSQRLREPPRLRASPPPLSLLLCCSGEWRRHGVLADRGVNCSCSLGSPGRTPGGRESASAMGQLCCFPFSRDEEKISKWDLHCAES